jgi:SAM-dependent methyltransferase
MRDLDAKESLLEHKKIINSKLFLKNVYIDFYKILKSHKAPKKGLLIEVGSGGGFLKRFIPKVITTDVLKVDGIDRKLDLENIKLKSNSVSAFYMLNVFHHIKNPKRALSEMERCLVDEGKIIMIEPWPTIFSKFIYKNFHHETFDTNSDWKVRGTGRMSDANGALPWIIFKRDKQKFEKLFPNLKIEIVKPHTPFKYLLSGGLSHKQVLPSFFYPFLNIIEIPLRPFNKFLAMFATIIISKAGIHIEHD